MTEGGDEGGGKGGREGRRARYVMGRRTRL